MKLFKLLKLVIVNFKGIPHFEVDFRHITTILGDNGTGKTTVFDAFLWLFFGKNSEGDSQFSVKFLDEKGSFVKNQEAEVSALVYADEQEIVIKKVLRQKWVQRRGSLETEYNGDENVYFWNDVPMKETDFKNKVKAIIDENLFRLITDPFYFNNDKLVPWTKRREILVDIAGAISNGEIIEAIGPDAKGAHFQALIKALNQKKTIKEFTDEITAKKKKIKDELDLLPSRIDEVRRGIPESTDFDDLRVKLKEAQQELAAIQSSLSEESTQHAEENKQRNLQLKEYNDKVRDRQQRIFKLKTDLQNIEFEAKQQARAGFKDYTGDIRIITGKLEDKKAELKSSSDKIVALEKQVSDKEAQVQALREKYEVASDEHLSFLDGEFVCPTCQQSLPEQQRETKQAEMQKTFNEKKSKKLSDLVTDAGLLNKEIEVLKTRISNGITYKEHAQSDIDKLESQLADLKAKASEPQKSLEERIKDILAADANYTALKSELELVESEKLYEPVFEPLQTNITLSSKQQEINTSIFSLQQKLAAEDLITKSKARIAELTQQEEKLAQEKAELEGVEFAILQFSKAKVDVIERRINGKFRTVRFKMFIQQVNGGEKECCETLVNTNGSWVPFSDANYAGRVNAGIDIINTLCEHYQVSAPIFVDNRESVTKLIDTDCQIINLFKKEDIKKLMVA